MKRGWAPAAVLLAAVVPVLGRKKPAPESIPQCSREMANVRRAVVLHLGGCARPPANLRDLADGLGEAGSGWSLALATDESIRELRRKGCPTAVVCTSGNELAALQQSLPVEQFVRLIEEVKARARPPLRDGVDGGPLVPWE